VTCQAVNHSNTVYKWIDWRESDTCDVCPLSQNFAPWSRIIMGGIVSRLQSGWSGVWILQREKDCSFLLHNRTGCGAHRVSCRMGTRVFFCNITVYTCTV